MPENPIQKAATGVVAGGTDEIDIELADEQESHPIKENIKDKIERKDDEKESEEAEQTEDMKEEMWDEADSSILDEIWGGISIFGKTVGTTVAKGFKMVQKVVVGGGVNAPEGELWTRVGQGQGLTLFSSNQLGDGMMKDKNSL